MEETALDETAEDNEEDTDSPGHYPDNDDGEEPDEDDKEPGDFEDEVGDLTEYD